MAAACLPALMDLLTSEQLGYVMLQVLPIATVPREAKHARKARLLQYASPGQRVEKVVRQVADLVSLDCLKAFLRARGCRIGRTRADNIERILQHVLADAVPALASGSSAGASSSARASAQSDAVPDALVLHEKRPLQARLMRRWARAAEKWSRRVRASRAIKGALRAELAASPGRTLNELRAAVARIVGMSLEAGHERVFYEKHLQKLLSPKPPRKRRRRAPTVVHDVSVGNPVAEHRERGRMWQEDHLSEACCRA